MRHLMVVVLLVSTFYALTTAALRQGPYSYDESDYMYAVHQGWSSHWFDLPSLSLPTFVKMGMDAGRDPAMRTQLSESIRQSGDILFYRHWHGPMYFYGLSLLNSGTLSENQMRAAAAWIPALGILFVYGSTLWLFPGQVLPSALAAALYGWGHSVVATTELAPHQLFIVLSLVPLFFLAKFHLSHEWRWWWCAAASSSLAFATMEVAFVGIGVMLLLGWKHRKEWSLTWPRVGRLITFFLVPALLLWPAGILKLSLIRSYMFMAYLAVFRRGAWGDVTLAGTWASRLKDAPLEWLLVVVALGLWWRYRRNAEFRAATPFLLFGLLMLGVTLKVYATAPRYTLPTLAPLLVAAGLVLGLALERLKTPGVLLAGLLVLGVGAETWSYVQAHVPRPDERSQHILEALRSDSVLGPILVPQEDVPLLHYYFPNVPLKVYRNGDEQRVALGSGSKFQFILVEDPAMPVQPLP